MVLGTPIGYQLGNSISMLLDLVRGTSFGIWERTLVGVSLVTIVWLMIGTGEGYLVGLSLVLPLGSPLESPNPGNMLGSLFGSINDMTLDISLWNPLVSLCGSIWHVNWRCSWIVAWKILLRLKLVPLFDLNMTWNLSQWLPRWWELYLEIIQEGILRNF